MSGLGVFISYRRDDSAGYAGRLYDRLCERFGKDRLFIDVDTIAPGADFVARIDEALAECGVLIAMIGTGWEDARNALGGRRLEDPRDFVRLEIAEALARGISVIPILVRRAKMPEPESLPEPLRPLALRQALELDDARWGYDVGRLVEVLEQLVGEPGSTKGPSERSGPARRRRGLVAGVGVAVLAIVTAGSVALVRLGGTSEEERDRSQMGSPATSASLPATSPTSAAPGSPSPSPGIILLRDGFSPHVSDHWLIRQHGPYRFAYAGGHYRMTVGELNSWAFSAFRDPELPGLPAVGVEVDVVRMSGPGAVWAGLARGYQGGGRFTYIGFVTLSGKYGLVERDGGFDDHLTQGLDAPVRIQGVNHLRLDCVEDPAGGVRLTLWVNDAFMGEAHGSEASLTAGRVGLVAGTSAHPSEVEFDDFVIRDLSA